MFDLLIVTITLSAWGFGLWCYPKCINYVTNCYNSNTIDEDQIIVDEALATLNYPIYYTDDIINFDEEIMNEICLHHSDDCTHIMNEEKIIDENITSSNKNISNQTCTTQETIPVAKLITRGYFYCRS